MPVAVSSISGGVRRRLEGARRLIVIGIVDNGRIRVVGALRSSDVRDDETHSAELVGCLTSLTANTCAVQDSNMNL